MMSGERSGCWEDLLKGRGSEGIAMWKKGRSEGLLVVDVVEAADAAAARSLCATAAVLRRRMLFSRLGGDSLRSCSRVAKLKESEDGMLARW